MRKLLFCITVLLLGLVGCIDNSLYAEQPHITELSVEKELQIREGFFVLLHESENDWVELDDILIARYYGTFGGREVVSMGGTFGFDMAGFERTIAGYHFWFPHMGFYLHRDGDHTRGIHIWVHDNGNFMCICEAYEDGLLTAEDIGVIWEQHRRQWVAEEE